MTNLLEYTYDEQFEYECYLQRWTGLIQPSSGGQPMSFEEFCLTLKTYADKYPAARGGCQQAMESAVKSVKHHDGLYTWESTLHHRWLYEQDPTLEDLAIKLVIA